MGTIISKSEADSLDIMVIMDIFRTADKSG